jgi:mono/diheme cytochrome c family protein
MRRAIVAILLAAPPAFGGTPVDLLGVYETQARRADPSYAGASVQRGAALYGRADPGGGSQTCASCHSPDPRGAGRHARTGKAIEPLAPAANSMRLTDAAKAEKWFGRNCRDVLARECTPQEKADFVRFLIHSR